MKLFSIIVATDIKGGIGKDNKIPFINKKDLLNFKNITTNSSLNKKNAVIMGKNTWMSLPQKPLFNRYNIIISTSLELSQSQPLPKNTFICSSIEQACNFCSNMENTIDKVFIIGGEKIYNYCFTHLFSYIDTIYYTRFHNSFDCDCFFAYYSLLQTMQSFDIIKLLEFKEDEEFTYTVWKIHSGNVFYTFSHLYH